MHIADLASTGYMADFVHGAAPVPIQQVPPDFHLHQQYFT